MFVIGVLAEIASQNFLLNFLPMPLTTKAVTKCNSPFSQRSDYFSRTHSSLPSAFLDSRSLSHRTHARNLRPHALCCDQSIDKLQKQIHFDFHQKIYSSIHSLELFSNHKTHILYQNSRISPRNHTTNSQDRDSIIRQSNPDR